MTRTKLKSPVEDDERAEARGETGVEDPVGPPEGPLRQAALGDLLAELAHGPGEVGGPVPDLVFQPVQGLPELRLRPLPPGEVLQLDDIAGALFRPAPEGRDQDVEVDDAGTAGPVELLPSDLSEIEEDLVANGAPAFQPVQGLGGKVRIVEQAESPDLRGVDDAEDLQGGLVDLDEPALGVVELDPDGRFLEDLPEALFAPAGGRLRWSSGPSSRRASIFRPADEGLLVVVEDVDDLLGAASVEGIGAEGEHPGAADRGIDLGLVIREPRPVLLLEPERIAGEAEPVVAPGQGTHPACRPRP